MLTAQFAFYYFRIHQGVFTVLVTGPGCFSLGIVGDDQKDSNLKSWNELLDKRLLLSLAEGECAAARQRWLRYEHLLVKKTTYPQVKRQGQTAVSDPLRKSDFRNKQSQ